MHQEEAEETNRWSSRAVALAEELGDDEVRIYALTNVANMEYLRGRGLAKTEECLRLALEAGLEEHVGRAYVSLAWWSPRGRHYATFDKYVEEGLEYCAERGLDLWRAFLLAHHDPGTSHQRLLSCTGRAGTAAPYHGEDRSTNLKARLWLPR